MELAGGVQGVQPYPALGDGQAAVVEDFLVVQRTPALVASDPHPDAVPGARLDRPPRVLPSQDLHMLADGSVGEGVLSVRAGADLEPIRPTHRRAADSGKEMAPALIDLAITIAYLAIALTS